LLGITAISSNKLTLNFSEAKSTRSGTRRLRPKISSMYWLLFARNLIRFQERAILLAKTNLKWSALNVKRSSNRFAMGSKVQRKMDLATS
jgi:hypothetical protein